jgi:hypothetical protein
MFTPTSVLIISDAGTISLPVALDFEGPDLLSRLLTRSRAQADELYGAGQVDIVAPSFCHVPVIDNQM